HIYAMITIPDFDHPLLKKPQFVLIARILNEHVIIDVDITDRPLFEELMRCGIPREQIVLAYAGEQFPPAESEK
ncbi:MAG TPA: element excision factor XisI family protein, partial [Aggregatilineales bacterium]|nr:element excision factor XisI family protein [Aggregatilineales bacterium]